MLALYLGLLLNKVDIRLMDLGCLCWLGACVGLGESGGLLMRRQVLWYLIVLGFLPFQ